MATVVELPLETYKGPVDPDWCPGCGDFGVLRTLQRAAGKLGIHPKDLMVVSGIGCSSNLPGYIHAYGFHGLHGRALAQATGMKLGNHDLHVVITGGDGDGYGIGIQHFIHSMRRNIDLTYIVMDNEIYGLTTGQASPTTERGEWTKSTPGGCPEDELNPLALAMVAGATYVARGSSAEQEHLTNLIAQGIQHKGFSLIDVFSPCVTFNKINTYPWFKERLYKLEDSPYDPTDLTAAMEKSVEWGSRIPIGLLYRHEKPTYEDTEPVLTKGPLVDQPLGIDPKMFAEVLAETM
jgi:2-oxoglutarate ferredoxin oxidoreductase subunit beta